jgi:hypothetical protein|tara:strand:+ start:109 stop:402 length:294 start_codon:yes stop_codon:yes gene_type:complete
MSYAVQLIAKDDDDAWATRDDVTNFEVIVWQDNGSFGFHRHDEIVNLPCERSARLIATFFCQRHRLKDFDCQYKPTEPRITLDNGWSVPIADDGSFA